MIGRFIQFGMFLCFTFGALHYSGVVEMGCILGTIVCEGLYLKS